MKRVTALLIISLLTALGAAGTASAQTLRLACPSAENSTTCLAAQHFADRANEEAGGDFEIQVFPGGQLGSGESAIQQMRAGVLDLVVEDITNLSNFVSDYNVVSWGFTFRDQEHFQNFLSSDLHAEMATQLSEEQGIELLANDWRKLPRVVVANEPIETPDDLSDVTFRVPGIPSYIETWETLGANTTQVPWADAFQALRTGTVDAMESPLDSVESQSFHVAAPNVSLTNHVYSSMTLLMNQNRWNSLTDEQREIMRNAADSAAERSAELSAQASNETIDQLRADGATIVEPQRELFAQRLNDAAQEQEEEGLWSEGLYDSIQEIE